MFSWNVYAAAERKHLLEAQGFRVDPVMSRGTGMVGKLKAAAPLALVIDLDSKPAYGREVAIYMRNTASVRHLPMVFAGGVAEKIARVRAEIPDAVYCGWDAVQAGINRAITAPPVRPVRPRARGEVVTSGSVLARKLDLRPEMRVSIEGDVIGLGKRLGLEYEERISRETGMAIVVLRTEQDLDAAFDYAAGHLPPAAGLWIVYPKRSGRLKADFSQKDLLAMGAACGLTGYKTCAVDADWSGLKFAWKTRSTR
jgi:CheY-like chemotaxis protein